MQEGEELVVETAQRILGRYGDPQAVNQSGDEAWKAPLWQELERAGVVTAWAAEASGGGGASLGLGFELARVAGRFALAAPLVESLHGTWLASAAGLPVPAARATVAIGADLAVRSGGVHGRAPAVAFAGETDDIVVLASDDTGRAVVAMVPAVRVTIEPSRTIAGDGRDAVRFDAVTPEHLAALPSGVPAHAVAAMGALLRSLQIAGALETALDLTVDWAKQRVAFGKPIAKFQAIQHSIAVMACEVAAATTAATSAAAAVEAAGALDVDDPGIWLEVAAAKVRCGEAAAAAARIAHQVHGAIGVSKEHVLHRFTMRALSWRDDFGDEAHWAADLGRRVAAAGADDLWPLLASR